MVYPDSPYAIPIGSFRRPVVPPNVDANAGPLVYVGLNCEWFPYIIGALKQLLLQKTWAVSSPADLNLIQMRVFSLIELFDCSRAPTIGDLCGLAGSSEGDEMCCCLRVQNGVLQVLSCGTWTDVPGQPPGGLGGPGQPGPGQPQPPAGGCTTYHAAQTGSSLWVLPTPVNAGDVLTISNQHGIFYDSHTAAWHCLDGELYFAGFCTGSFSTYASNPMPGVPTGKLIIQIGSTYYDAYPGPFTVPGGITNQQLNFLQNTSNLPSGGGDVTFDVQVCNNQPQTWSHTLNLAINPHLFTPRDMGIWTPGSGFTDTTVSYGPNIYRGADIQVLSLPGIHVTELAYQSLNALGAGAANVGIGVNTPGSYIATSTAVNGLHTYSTGPISVTGVNSIYFDNIIGSANGSDPGGTCVVGEAIISGVGFDPWA